MRKRLRCTTGGPRCKALQKPGGSKMRGFKNVVQMFMIVLQAHSISPYLFIMDSNAISLAVLCPLIASRATFALISMLYRFLCCRMTNSLQLSRYRYFILFPCPVLGGYY